MASPTGSLFAACHKSTDRADVSKKEETKRSQKNLRPGRYAENNRQARSRQGKNLTEKKISMNCCTATPCCPKSA